jgi:hypothetical protein
MEEGISAVKAFVTVLRQLLQPRNQFFRLPTPPHQNSRIPREKRDHPPAHPWRTVISPVVSAYDHGVYKVDVGWLPMPLLILNPGFRNLRPIEKDGRGLKRWLWIYTRLVTERFIGDWRQEYRESHPDKQLLYGIISFIARIIIYMIRCMKSIQVYGREYLEGE